jgi:DNA invertase Pin-like site-specific DNA recombinase
MTDAEKARTHHPRWTHVVREDAAAQERICNAEREYDDLIRLSLAHGLGVRGAARALKIHRATVSRRYKRGAE